MAATDAQKRASRKWDKAHKDKVRKTNYKSRAKSFIKKFADLDDLKEIKELVNMRKKELKK